MKTSRGGDEAPHLETMAPHVPLTERARELVAARFRALGEPMRLKILERLFRSPAAVGDILHEVGGTQANVSKHLGVLRTGALVRRRRDGSRIVYSIADPSIERLCALVCQAVRRDARDEAQAVRPQATTRQKTRG